MENFDNSNETQNDTFLTISPQPPQQTPTSVSNLNAQSNPQKPVKIFLAIFTTSLVVMVLSYVVAFASIWLLGKYINRQTSSEEMGGLGWIIVGFYFFYFMAGLGLLVFSLFSTRILNRRGLTGFVFWKNFLSVLVISSAMFYLFFNYVDPLIEHIGHPSPGYTEPVDQWNKLENADYSFSYPKDTNLSQKNITPGELDEVRITQTTEQYKKVNSVPLNESQSSVDLFDVSVINPDYYKNDVTDGSSAAKAYAEKIYQLNKYDPSHPMDDVHYSNVDGQVTATQIAGKTAYALTVVYLFKNPGGELPLRQVNGYSKGSVNLYYIDFKDKVYQVGLASQNEIGDNILKTLKFASDSNEQSDQVTQETFSVEGNIGYFNIDTAEKVDVTLSDNLGTSIIGLSNDAPRGPSDPERVDFRISSSTEFVVDNKTIDQSQIEKINNGKGNRGGIEAKYKQAKVEYKKYALDNNGDYYFVATRITLFENANPSDNTALPSASSNETATADEDAITLSPYDMSMPTSYQTKTGHAPIKTSGAIESFTSYNVTITNPSDSSATEEGLPINSNTTITDGTKATSLVVGKKIQLEYRPENNLVLRIWVEN